MYTLKLAANPQGWRAFMARKVDPIFVNFSNKVFRRDQFICQFCGFKAKRHQEVVNLDQDYDHNKLSNLVTACGFCAQCFFIESISTNTYGGGTVIYLPEIQQNYLNGFCHALFFAMAKKVELKDVAQDNYRKLKLRSQVIENQLGTGMSEPAALGQLLVESGASTRLQACLLDKLRLLPSRARFKAQVDYGVANLQ